MAMGLVYANERSTAETLLPHVISKMGSHGSCTIQARLITAAEDAQARECWGSERLLLLQCGEILTISTPLVAIPATSC